MKKTFTKLAAVSALVAGSFAAPAHAEDDAVKVGLILSLSGPGSVLGEEMQKGADLALEMLGGKLGGKAAQFIYEDDQRKPDVGKEAAEKLVRSEDVDVVIGSSFSNVMMAIHRPITRAGKIVLSPNPAPAPLAGEDCDPNYFAVPFQNDQLAEAVGIHLTNEGVENAFILAPNYQAGRDLLEGFKRTYKGEILGEIYTPLDQTDFSAELTQVKAANPAAVFVFYPGGLGIQWVKQYAQAGMKDDIPLYSAFTYFNGAALNAIGEAGLGLQSAAQWTIDLPSEANQEFVAAFRAKYDSPPSDFAAMAYDTVRLIDSAVAKVEGNVDDTDAFRAALHAADFASVRGEISFNTNNHPIQDMYLATVEQDDSGNFVAVSSGVIVEDMKDVYAESCEMN
ncbi:MAG: ABC transporter substrate-binding protein [Roseovarius sp.]